MCWPPDGVIKVQMARSRSGGFQDGGRLALRPCHKFKRLITGVTRSTNNQWKQCLRIEQKGPRYGTVLLLPLTTMVSNRNTSSTSRWRQYISYIDSTLIKQVTHLQINKISYNMVNMDITCSVTF